ncbi:MAG: hypothetical protein R3B93_10970 [Bacteroidia bacterium]
MATNTVVDTIEVGYGPVAAGNFISIYPNITNFTALPLNLPGFNKGAATWGNIEASGGLGFAIAGLGPGNVPTTQLYTYEGNDSFALFSALAVRNITADGPGYLDWGDFNNDNMIDLALAERMPMGKISSGCTEMIPNGWNSLVLILSSVETGVL